MSKNIELEFRAEIPKRKLNNVLNKLNQGGELISKTKRLSVMYFGKIGKEILDIRVRITNGDPELVIKKGRLHAHNRIELSQDIKKYQFIGIVKLMALFEFNIEVGERKTLNYIFKKNTIISLVKAGDLAYIEFEKMTNNKNLKQHKKELLNLIKKMDIKLIETKKEFDSLCKKLSDKVDWKFDGSKKHYNKLKKILSKY